MESEIYNKQSSFYILNPVYPTQSSNVTLGTSNNQVYFNIPTNVYGLEKTQIAFDIANITSLVNGVNNHMFVKKLNLFDYIQQITIYDQTTGFIIQDIKNIDTLSKIQQLYVNPLKNRDYSRGFLCKSCRTDQDVATGTTSDPYFQINPANGAHLNVIASASNIAINAVDTTIRLNNDSKANLAYGNYTNVDATTLQLPSVCDELCNIIHDSIFSLKKDIYLQNIVIKLVLNPITKIISEVASRAANSAVIDYAFAGVQLSNFRLNMFIQGDNMLNNMIVQKTLSGTQSFIIPEVIDNMVSMSAGANHSLNFVFSSRFNAYKLYKYYHFICATMAGQSCNNFCPSGNWTQVEIFYKNIKLRTLDNSAVITSSNYNGGFKDILRQYKTDNYTNPDDFNNDSFISTVFDDEKVECDDLKEYNSNKWIGVPFVGSENLQFKCTVDAGIAKQHFLFVVLQSILHQTNGVFHA